MMLFNTILSAKPQQGPAAFLVIVCISTLLVTSCSVSSHKKPVDVGFWHILKQNDTLEKIAVRYSVSKKIIQKKNDIYDAADLIPGMKVFIPGVRHVSKISQAPVSKHQFVWPARGVISSGFGTRHGKKHTGIDITKDQGRDIVASASGTVIFNGWKKGYGKVVIIDHGSGFRTLYAHNQTIYVRKGQYVKQYKKIALMGSTGRSSGIHLHFEIQKDGKPRNPLRYLPTR